MAGKTCQICGANSGIYPLCIKHLEMKAKGQVVKNEDSGKWELTDSKDTKPQNNKCILCGEETKNNYKLCKECYYIIEERKEDLDKNQRPQKLKDYYYNAKDYASRIYDENKIFYQQTTMIALAQILDDLYDDDTILNERLEEDLNKLNDIVVNRNKKLENSIKEKDHLENLITQKDSTKAKTLQTQDGHFVESELEIKVDDILYNMGEVHAYSIQVDEITERTVVCDWYIPVGQDKGIYIELWGVTNDSKYEKNKKEKIELYQKHKLKLIEIKNCEAKEDTKRLKSLIRSKIIQFKNELSDENKR